MLFLIKLIGLVIATMGFIFVLNPNKIKVVLNFLENEKKMRIVSSVKIVLGLILLAGASKCRVSLIPFVLGIVTIVKSVASFILGPVKVKAILKIWSEKSEGFLRLAAFIPMFIGLLLLYSIY